MSEVVGFRAERTVGVEVVPAIEVEEAARWEAAVAAGEEMI